MTINWSDENVRFQIAEKLEEESNQYKKVLNSFYSKRSQIPELNKEIESTTKKLKEVQKKIVWSDHCQGRSLAGRVRCGFAGAAAMLLLPVSWALGFAFLILPPIGGCFFALPIILGRAWFTMARGQEYWTKRLEAAKNEKELLIKTREDWIGRITKLKAELDDGVAKIDDLVAPELKKAAALLKLDVEKIKNDLNIPDLPGDASFKFGDRCDYAAGWFEEKSTEKLNATDLLVKF